MNEAESSPPAADHKHSYVCEGCQHKEPLMQDDGRPTPAGWREVQRRLQMPFKTFKSKGRGGTYDYITARQLGERLDNVVGAGNWAIELRVIRAEPPVSVAAGVAIFGVWKWGIGYSNNPDQVDEWIPEADRQGKPVFEDSGEPRMVRNPAYEQEPLKAAESDAIKRAGVHWGIGRSLYKEFRG